jgi:hypothetical protein
MEPTPVMREKEGDLGTLRLPGGGGETGVSLVLLFPDNAQEYCLGQIGHAIVYVLQMGLYDVAEHERQKLEVSELMVVNMNPAIKKTMFTAHEAPALVVDFLTDLQYAALIREQHYVGEWNSILLSIKEGNFKNESEFNEIKLRATRKPALGKFFTPRKKVKFVMGNDIEDVCMLDMGVT